MGRLIHLETLARLEAVDVDLERAAAQRDILDRVRERADLLAEEDRILLKTYLEAGSSYRELAGLVGMSRSSLCRRIHRMIRRLSDETYARCRRNEWQFSSLELDIIRDHFLRGWSLRRIGRNYDLCYYRVHLIIEKARTVARAPE